MKSIGGKIWKGRKQSGKSLGVKKENGETLTSLTLVGTE